MPRYENRNGLRFDQLCAPVFYFNKFGCQILRFGGALDVVLEEAAVLAKRGACGPLLVRDKRSGGLDDGGDPGGGSSTAGAAAPATCSDARQAKARSAPWVAAQLHPPGSACECSPPATLDLGLGVSGASGGGGGSGEVSANEAAATAQAAFNAHCAHAKGYENRACGSIGANTGPKRNRATGS